MEQYIQPHTLLMILCGIGMGTIARLITLHIDTRQTPSFPNGMFISIFLGFVASFLGAVAIPALLAQDLTAVTFLTPRRAALPGGAHRRAGDMELESTGVHQAGQRLYRRHRQNLRVPVLYLPHHRAAGGAGAGAAGPGGTPAQYRGCPWPWASRPSPCCGPYQGKCVGDICRIVQGRMTVEGSELYVDGMFVTNKLGTERSRELFLREGVAFVITPQPEEIRDYAQQLRAAAGPSL